MKKLLVVLVLGGCTLFVGCPHNGGSPDASTPTPDGSNPTDAGVADGSAGCTAAGCPGQFCSPQLGICVDCLTSTDCTDPYFPTCDPTNGTCVQCLAPSDCPLFSPGCFQGYCGSCGTTTDCPANFTCDPTLSQCACTSSAACGGLAPVCIPETQQCGCGVTSQCPSGLVCDHVNYQSGFCVIPCTTDAGACVAGSPSPFCIGSVGAADYGLCVPCVDDSQCVTLGLGRFCTSSGCVDCRGDIDCSADAGTPKCLGICVQCATPQDCPSGQGCDSSSNTCGSGCTLNSDCPSGKGCTPLNTCGALCIEGAVTPNCAQCLFNADCPSTAPYCGGNGNCATSPTDGGSVLTGPCGPGCGGDLVCDPVAKKCVECLASSDCLNSQRPHCNTTTNTCVQCLTPTDCPFHLLGCFGGWCGSCGGDTDCPANDTCNPNTGLCECSSNTGCGGDAPACLSNHACGCSKTLPCPSGLICDTVGFGNGACVANCVDGGGACNPSGAYPYCDTSATSGTFGLCLGCLNDTQCVASGLGPYCTQAGCSHCRTNADCSGTTPFCARDCVQCLSYTDCAVNTPCDSVTGRCGTCSQGSDCPPDAGTCSLGKCL